MAGGIRCSLLDLVGSCALDRPKAADRMYAEIMMATRAGRGVEDIAEDWYPFLRLYTQLH